MFNFVSCMFSLFVIVLRYWQADSLRFLNMHGMKFIYGTHNNACRCGKKSLIRVLKENATRNL